METRRFFWEVIVFGSPAVSSLKNVSVARIAMNRLSSNPGMRPARGAGADCGMKQCPVSGLAYI